MLEKDIQYLAEVISENEGFDREEAEASIRGALNRFDPDEDFDGFYDEVLRACRYFSK